MKRRFFASALKNQRLTGRQADASRQYVASSSPVPVLLSVSSGTVNLEPKHWNREFEYYIREKTIERYTKRHIDSKCIICDARIYIDKLCTKCQFDKLPSADRNRLTEIAQANDLAELKLAVKGISASENKHLL